MKRILLFFMVGALLLAVLPATACSGTTKVGDISAAPLQFEGKQVSIKGTVGDTLWFAALGKGAYQLGDGSGLIWVVTTQPPPQKGQSVSCEGTVTTAFKIGDQTLGTVITETKRG
jgi:hypothetical protein